MLNGFQRFMTQVVLRSAHNHAWAYVERTIRRRQIASERLDVALLEHLIHLVRIAQTSQRSSRIVNDLEQPFVLAKDSRGAGKLSMVLVRCTERPILPLDPYIEIKKRFLLEAEMPQDPNKKPCRL